MRARPGAEAGGALLLLVALLFGCGEDDRGGAREDGGAPSAGAGAAGAPELRRAPSLVSREPPLRERGVGVVSPYRPLDAPPGSGSDTLVVRARPDAGAPMVARLVRSPTGEYALEAGEEVTEGGAIDHGYEEVGLPLLDPPEGAPSQLTDPSADEEEADPWLRVHYGRATDGSSLEGWVSNDPGRVEVLLWSERLPELPLFFLDPDSIRFHDSPEGPRVGVQLTSADGPERFDYIMHPLETRGPWMRVEVVTPKDYCFDPPAPLRDTVWVRYLDNGAEPRVWYYTRGC